MCFPRLPVFLMPINSVRVQLCKPTLDLFSHLSLNWHLTLILHDFAADMHYFIHFHSQNSYSLYGIMYSTYTYLFLTDVNPSFALSPPFFSFFLPFLPPNPISLHVYTTMCLFVLCIHNTKTLNRLQCFHLQ